MSLLKIDNNIAVMASEKIKNGNRIDVLIQKKKDSYITCKK